MSVPGTAPSALNPAAANAIAIVGMSGCFPGAADVTAFWRNVREGVDSITRFTRQELAAAGVPIATLDDPDYVPAGPVLDGVELFDAEFFGFTPAEAQIMDPQHRLFLEHCWRAMEDGGHDPRRAGGPVGVFGGCAMSSYLQHNLLADPRLADTVGSMAIGLGNDKDSLTTRVAHVLGLVGPAYNIQSYCSTSLVAVAAAASSLSAGECDLALAGGVSIAVPHKVGYRFQPGGIASPDGVCRPFDTAANGAPLGSGVAVVLLRRLADALDEGDHIYALIRGWAVNNDGAAKVGFTAPGVRGQAAAVTEALAHAGLRPRDIDYIEAHGTGTALGDAAELASLRQVFAGTDGCAIGSVKSNVGHLDRAAGATGLIKTALALRAELIPATVHVTDPRPDSAPLAVVTQPRPWVRGERIRRAGVSAFGIGGTNAHVVLEEAPPRRPDRSHARSHQVLVWSARTEAALTAMTAQLAAEVGLPSASLADAAYTLQTGRAVLEHRHAVVAATGSAAAAAMAGHTTGPQLLGAAESQTDRRAGFLIAGVGEQYPGMAAGLYEQEPAFAAVLDECGAFLRDVTGTDPVRTLLQLRPPAASQPDRALFGGAPPDGGDPALHRTELIQPAVFAIEYALASLLTGWGVRPDVMLGHSLGELVACALSGALTWQEALGLVAFRAQAIAELPPGAMIVVPLGADELAAAAEQIEDGPDVAVLNAARMTVASGTVDAVRRLDASLARRGVPTRWLDTGHAFHSRQLAPITDRLTAWARDNLSPRPPRIPYYSNVTGTIVTAEQISDPRYWSEHMCSPVQFDRSLSALLRDDARVLVEVGPGRSLGALVRGHPDCPRERWTMVVDPLRAALDPRGDSEVLAEALGRMWLAGTGIDWTAYQDGRGSGRTPLPTYPFQRRRYWLDPPVTAPADATARESATEPDPETAGAPAGPTLTVPSWNPSSPATGVPDGPCLVVGDDRGLGTAVARRLRERGVPVRQVPAGAGLPADIAVDPPAHVLHLGGLGARDLASARAAFAGFCGFLADLGEAGGAAPRTLIAVTRHGQAVRPGETPDPGQALVPVACVVAGQEYGHLDCRAVDLGDGDTEDAADALVAELSPAAVPGAVAYRGTERLVREMVAATAASGSASVIRPGGTYLITGGLGDVGLALAEQLCRTYKAQVVLTTRGRGPAGADPGTGRDGVRRSAVDALVDAGADIVVETGDVTDLARMRELVGDIRRRRGRLDGVLHAAGVTDPEAFRPLRGTDQAVIDAHLTPKGDGAGVLEELLRGADTDFCVLFSSVSAVLGGIGFAAYGAANAVLDAIAQRHRDDRVRWLSLGWDTWLPTLGKLDASRRNSAMAEHVLTVPEAVRSLQDALRAVHPWLLVAKGDLADRMAAPRPVPDEVPAAQLVRHPRGNLPQDYRPPRTAVESRMAELWGTLLGIDEVGVHDNYFDLGGNSLAGLQLLSRVRREFGVALPAVALFEAPTVAALVALLPADTAASTGKPSPAPAAAVPAPAAVAQRGAAAPVAIIGLAGRFPGAADIEQFWQNLVDGVESISFFTRAELIAAGVPEETLDHPDYVPARPVLEDVDRFDAEFFGYSPREAAIADPQQRLFLEATWQALEHAGYASPAFRGRVGVFAGANISTYLLDRYQQIRRSGEADDYEMVMGNDKDALTTTASYRLDLRGPSISVQSFCSTSLVAVHLACQSLRRGECDLAIAGGVSVRIPDRVGHRYYPGGMESPDGHVRTFDAGARGSMFGDGVALVVLKRLDAAQRDRDAIWGSVIGSAMNNDGALKVGYTAPSVSGQSSVVAAALQDAGVSAEDISYVEAHGTGTALGDPIELAALTRAYGDTARKQYCAIGSVKTNVGHLDRAAGVTGLIKTLLSLRHGTIPRTLHYRKPNPQIDFADSPFFVAAEPVEWPVREGHARIAGINSLGMGGTNVHLVVAEPPRPLPTAAPSRRRHQAILVSARSADAADAYCESLGAELRTTPPSNLADVAYTLQVGRELFAHRRAAVGSDPAELAGALAEPDAGGRRWQRTDPVVDRGAAFVFSGVGEQYRGMVGELYRREPRFRESLDECAEQLGELLPDDLTAMLTGSRRPDQAAGAQLAELLGRRAAAPGTDDPLSRPALAHPAVFAVEYALARTLMSWAVRPSLMLGYSVGEYVAACHSGVLSAADALRLLVYRARLIEPLGSGGMLAVLLPVDALLGRITTPLSERGLDIAVDGGPQTTVAGPDDALAELADELRRGGAALRRIDTTHAFHSRMMAPAAAGLTEWIRDNVTLHEPTLPYVSNVTGRIATAALVTAPEYWARHMCEPVRFADGVSVLLGSSGPPPVLLEVGAGQSLGALVRAHPSFGPDHQSLMVQTLPAAHNPSPDDAVLAGCLARLWLAGVPVDWTAYHSDDAPRAADGTALGPRRVPLPTYRFQRQSYWMARTEPLEGGPHRSSGEQSTLADAEALPMLAEKQWIHQPLWRQAPGLPAAVPAATTCLVLADGADLPGSLVGLLVPRWAGLGARLVVARSGDRFAADRDGFVLRPGEAEDVTAMLRILRERGQLPTRVAHLWTAGNGTDAASVEESLTRGLHSLLALVRAMGEFDALPEALDVVTSGAYRVHGDEVLHPGRAAAVGVCRVLPLEEPTVRTRLIDLPAGVAPGAVLDALLGELAAPPTADAAEPVVALRGRRRWIPDYAGWDAAPTGDAAPSAPFRQGGTYLITGGLGGIGLAMADRLVAEFGATLVLLNRTGLSTEDGIGTAAENERARGRAAAVDRLRAAGAGVEVVVGDVTRVEDVRRAADLAIARFGRLDGVLHTAGVPAQGLMQLKTRDAVDAVLDPKIRGTLALAEALRDRPVDLLVLFGSITALTGGGPGQSDYCAANAFLDCYAQTDDSPARRVVAVDWGEWTWNAWDSGLAGYDPHLRDFFRAHRERFGIGFDPGWRSLLRILGGDEPQLVVSTQDFSAITAISRHFSVEAVQGPPESADVGRHPRPALGTPFVAPRDRAEQAVAEIWGDFLKLEEVGRDDNFFDLGGNSLVGIMVVSRIRKALGAEQLPPHVLYAAPTVAALAAAAGGATPTPPATEGADLHRRADQRRAALRNRRAGS